MGFNTKYILSGDDKTEIISKVNQNFSQIYYGGVGLQGEKGIMGPTGIIGQVGKNGLTGASGERANIWIFQDEPPGIYSSYPIPLENYDVWVNTSPTGSTGGQNRIYRFNSTYGGGDFGFFWIDTGENFVSGNTFNLIQGISGPSEIRSRNAIVSATGSTFVFSDNEVTSSNANPTYSKALISNRGFTTAELPLLTFGKTFYSATGAPSFVWKNTTDYSVQFSSNEFLFIESQATGTYSSTGGTLGVEAGRNFTVNTSLSLGITGPSGISISTGSFGVSSPNFISENSISLPTQSGGFVIGASSSGNSLIVGNNPIIGNDSRLLTVLNFSGGPSGGVLKPNINFSMGGDSLFRVNNASSESYPTLSIGYTGSTGFTGPSGGTGANVYKSFQTVTSNASSKGFFADSPSSNYITVNLNSDIIRVVPDVSPGTSISSNGRDGRIWLYITGIFDYVERDNLSQIELFMDSTAYSIGGIAFQTNQYYLDDNAEYKIYDGGTGPHTGCRYVKISFFGTEFPYPMNNPELRWACIESYSSFSVSPFGANASSLVPYYVEGN